jgi:hypothetical protein
VCYTLVTCRRRSPYAYESKEVAVLPLYLLMIFIFLTFLLKASSLWGIYRRVFPGTSPREWVVIPTTWVQDCNTSFVMCDGISTTVWGGGGFCLTLYRYFFEVFLIIIIVIVFYCYFCYYYYMKNYKLSQCIYPVLAMYHR